MLASRSITPSQSALKKVILYAVIPLLSLCLNGCAMRKPFRFQASSITRITYDPASCSQLPDGKFKCKDVVFTVAAVERAR